MPNTCTHHFIIPPPNGSVPIGKCKLCGLEREMSNFEEFRYSGWQHTKNNIGKAVT